MTQPTGKKHEPYIQPKTDIELTDLTKKEEKETEISSTTGEKRVSIASDSKFQTTTSIKQADAKTSSFHGARALWNNFVTNFHNFFSNIMKGFQKPAKKIELDNPKPDAEIEEGLDKPVLNEEDQRLLDVLYKRETKPEEKLVTESKNPEPLPEKKKPVEVKPIEKPSRKQISEDDKKICEKRKENLIDQLFPEDIKNLEKVIDNRITELAANFNQPAFKTNETLDDTITRFKNLPASVTYDKSRIQNQTLELLNIKKEIANNGDKSPIVNQLFKSDAWNSSPLLKSEVMELEAGKGLASTWDKIIDYDDLATGKIISLNERDYEDIVTRYRSHI